MTDENGELVLFVQHTEQALDQTNDPMMNAIAIAEPAVAASVSRSVTMVRAGGTQVPLRRGRQCKVCNSGYREFIEAQCLQGLGNKAVAAALPEELPVKINANNIGSHRKKHMSDVTIMAALEHSASAMGVSVDDAVAGLITPMAFASVVLQKSMIGLSSLGGDYIPSVGEGLAAGRLLTEIIGGLPATPDERFSVEEMAQHLTRHLEQHCPPQVLQQLAQAFAKDPVLAQHLLGPTPEDQGIEDAEVVDEDAVEDDRVLVSVGAEPGLKEITAHRMSLQGNLTEDDSAEQD